MLHIIGGYDVLKHCPYFRGKLVRIQSGQVDFYFVSVTCNESQPIHLGYNGFGCAFRATPSPICQKWGGKGPE